MMRGFVTALVLSVLAALLAPASAYAPELGSIYKNAQYGYSIESPKFPGVPPGASVVTAMFFGPAVGGFASNMNVMIQNTPLKPDAFRELSLRQFKAARFTVTKESKIKVSGYDAFIFEYEGKQQGRPIKWLALSVITGNKVYLVTCTTPAGEFVKHEEEFRKCLASFKVVR